MASLKELLAREGFESGRFPLSTRKLAKPRGRIIPDETIPSPIYICHDCTQLDSAKHETEKAFLRGGSSLFSSKMVSSDSERSSSKPFLTDKPAVDGEVATRAVVSILSGYIGRYLKEETFRETLREKCSSCLRKEKKDLNGGILADMEMGIQSIEILLENRGWGMESMETSLQNSIWRLNNVASLNSKYSKKCPSGGIPRNHLSACAHLYLAIAYKLERNDIVSAAHLLQVFCESPFLVRTHLLSDLWEHLFLPHLLHLKIWYGEELEFISNSRYGVKEKTKALTKLYNDQMDMGTAQFACYYQEWLKVGDADAPAFPSVPLPSRPSCRTSRRRSSDSFSSHSSRNNSIYRSVFSHTLQRQSVDLDEGNGGSINARRLKEEQKMYIRDGKRVHRRSSNETGRNAIAELLRETRKSDYFWFFPCQSVPTRGCSMHGNHIDSNNKEENVHLPLSDLSRAVATICYSDIITDCEVAVRVIIKTWLDLRGDSTIETALLKEPLIEGMLEVLSASENDEILELIISILAEFVGRNEMFRLTILNSDPQLEIFIKLLRNSNLFLKAAVLLHLIKPKAKQMISIEWVPLVLRVLEFGDQLQTLFSICCNPQVAAYYFLDQLVTGFNEDRNFENARHIVSLGGLNLLVRRVEKGDFSERNYAAQIISSCIRADGRCRQYLVKNLNLASILELLFRRQTNSSACICFVLIELLCLDRRTQIATFLNGLKHAVGGLNTMHILLAHLLRAPPEEQPLVAAILLQLDLLGDPLKSSVYREEALEAIIAGLYCLTCNIKVQEQSARALLILGGRFSYTGETLMEKWILQEAGFDERSEDSFHRNDILANEFVRTTEDAAATENWQKTAATALLSSRGNERFFTALADSMANGIPCLARASLVTISWMSSFLHSIEDDNFQSMACSILMPKLLRYLSHDKSLEERVMTSFSLLNLMKTSGCVSMLSLLNRGLVEPLRSLCQVTWTANELISIITGSSQSSEPSEFQNMESLNQSASVIIC
ncbi:putative E3 ubiquitin-protein ligase LIN isoform X2 [Malania oleifera]|uniref:putative E3 ubiquitin-protein ligase LIN isoform X2 n=1 Tax=Malania oleifera TaxID=397392 RepID=UPI0025AEB3EF|nr:putative E3 ubiquitin-protein ligase LIN isoform X2 [Malania oleifera]